MAGDHFSDPSRVPPGLAVLKDSAGFDGQFYYRLALNPFSTRLTDFGITLDKPALQHQRILYPLASWALSLGNHALLPAAMILINLSALCALGWLGASYARALKRHALWGIFVPLYPGFLLTLARDTPEILEAAALLGSLLLLRKGKPVPATLLLALALLTKETAVLVALAAGGLYIAGVLKVRTKATLPWYYAAIPLALFSLWQLILFRVWGEFPLWASGDSNLGLPFAGLGSSILDVALFQRPFQHRKFAELIFLLAFALAVLSRLRPAGATAHEVLCWILSAALVVSLGGNVWLEDWTFLRVSSPLYVLGAVILLADGRKVKSFAFGCSPLVWCLLFSMLMRSYTL